jgi:regulator of sigma E protease
MQIFLLVLGLVLFVGLVVVHELGHFLVARRNGVDAEEFGIGFPPPLLRRRIKSKRGDFDFTWNLLPLGGFVKLKGEHDTDTEPGSFGAASVWAKTKIMAAGVAMNVLTAFILFSFVALVGMPKLVDNQFTIKRDTKVSQQQLFVGDVEANSPASRAGLAAGDKLVSLTSGARSVNVSTAESLPSITKSFAGERVRIAYKRDGQAKTAVATLRTTTQVTASQKTKNPKGYLGISPSSFVLQRSTWSAPIVALGLMWQLTVLTFQGLGHSLAQLGGIIVGAVTENTPARQHAQTAASENVTGPIGIFFLLKSGSILGLQFILFITAYISLTLGVMNILPVPALDGGRLWLTLISRAFKRPLSQRLEERINLTGFVVLMSLIILICYVDINRFILHH